MDSDVYYKNGAAWRSGTGQKKGTVTEGGALADGGKTGTAPAAAAPAVSYAEQAWSAAGQDSYFDGMMELYEASLAAQRARREAAYNAAVEAQRAAYNNSVGKVNNAADKALQEAYINRMQSQRIQKQNLSAMGLSGGAAETAQASLLNGYGNARNNIETGRMSQISELGATLAKNIAAARNILESGSAGDYGDFLDRTAELYADNLTRKNSTGGSTGSRAGSSFYAALLRSMMGSGASEEQAANALMNAGVSAERVQQYFAQLEM